MAQAKQTVERWDGLQALDSVSQQDFGDKRSAREQAAGWFFARASSAATWGGSVPEVKPGNK